MSYYFEVIKADPIRYAEQLAYQREWRRNNPRVQSAERKEYVNRWKLAHPERVQAHNEKWQKLHRPRAGQKLPIKRKRTYDDIVEMLRTLPAPLRPEAYAQAAGITHATAANIFTQLLKAGKIAVTGYAKPRKPGMRRRLYSIVEVQS